MINSTKFCAQVVTWSTNNNIKLLDILKQGFKRSISWKYRFEITIQSKINNRKY